MGIFSELFKLKEPFMHRFIGTEKEFDEHLELIINHSNKTVVSCINGDLCKRLDEFFKELKFRLKFPDYFGGNWAAFDECMNDLDWLEGEGYIILIKNADVLLELKRDFGIFIKIINKTINEWVNGRSFDDFPTKPTPFHVVFHCQKNNETELGFKFKEVEINILEINLLK